MLAQAEPGSVGQNGIPVGCWLTLSRNAAGIRRRLFIPLGVVRPHGDRDEVARRAALRSGLMLQPAGAHRLLPNPLHPGEAEAGPVRQVLVEERDRAPVA